MRKLLLLLMCVVLVAGCNIHRNSRAKYNGAPGTSKHNKQLKYIPEEFRNLYLGMPLEEAKKARPEMSVVAGVMSFRQEYVEEINKGDIQQVVYYFDSEGEQILYEFIIDYKTESSRNIDADKLLGEPNFANEKEWLYNSGEGFKIHAWTFKKKLVIVGKIVGTEWADEE